jgi:hypothetical protein
LTAFAYERVRLAGAVPVTLLRKGGLVLFTRSEPGKSVVPEERAEEPAGSRRARRRRQMPLDIDDPSAPPDQQSTKAWEKKTNSIDMGPSPRAPRDSLRGHAVADCSGPGRRSRRTAPTRTRVGGQLHHVAALAARQYSTILVDLEKHKVIDLLSDRTVETLAEWLRQHPGIELVSRDRSSAYAQAIAEGPPTPSRSPTAGIF